MNALGRIRKSAGRAIFISLKRGLRSRTKQSLDIFYALPEEDISKPNARAYVLCLHGYPDVTPRSSPSGAGPCLVVGSWPELRDSLGPSGVRRSRKGGS